MFVGWVGGAACRQQQTVASAEIIFGGQVNESVKELFAVVADVTIMANHDCITVMNESITLKCQMTHRGTQKVSAQLQHQTRTLWKGWRGKKGPVSLLRNEV